MTRSVPSELISHLIESKKEGKIRNRYNLAQNTNRKVTTSQRDITNVAKRSALSQQVTTRHQQIDVHESITKQDRNKINDPQKKHLLGTVSKNILLEGLTSLTVHQPHP